jgi:outer membrane protein
MGRLRRSRHPLRPVSAAAALACALLAACQALAPNPAPAAPDPGSARVAEPAAPARPARAQPTGEADRLLQLARENNSTLSQARARVGMARAELEQTEAALRPRLSFDAAYLVADSPSMYLVKAIDSHELAPNTDFNDPGSFQSTEAGLALRWNLWNGGRDTLAREGADAAVQARTAEVAAVYEVLAGAVLAAWVELGIARELEQADEASIAALRAGVESTTRRVAAGSALRAEQLSLEVRLAQAQERLESMHLARRLAAATLRRLCGPDSDAGAGADESAGFAPAPATLEAAFAEALASRSDLRALGSAVTAAEKRLEAEQRSGRPTLDLEGRVYGTGLDMDPILGDPNASLGLGLHWDLADGGARRARRHAAQAALRDSQARRRAAEENATLEVESAWWQLEHARARLVLAETGLRAADETFALVEAQQREGSATVSRFLEVEADRTQARATRAQARLGLIGQQAALASALGRWSR